MRTSCFSVLLVVAVLVSCSHPVKSDQFPVSVSYARYFDISEHDSTVVISSISPYDGSRDSLSISGEASSVVCMSSTYAASFSALDAAGKVCAVSGKNFYCDTVFRCNPSLPDIGYENTLDYEKLVELNPDLVLAYSVGRIEPASVGKMRSLGLKVLVLYDHMETHPLARAEYIRLCGAVSGKLERADSLFSEIESSYLSSVSSLEGKPKVKVLLNVPYGGIWYVPGRDSYMSRLISDAGGEVLGCEPGASSSAISLEKAFSLSREADFWLDTGDFDTREELSSAHLSFKSFGPMDRESCIFNNTLRKNPEGGNDFFESGAVRPDLVLSDLAGIFSGENKTAGGLNYYIEVK